MARIQETLLSLETVSRKYPLQWPPPGPQGGRGCPGACSVSAGSACADAAVQNAVPVRHPSTAPWEHWYSGEALAPGWLHVDFLFKEQLDFAWGRDVQTWSAVKQNSWGNYSIWCLPQDADPLIPFPGVSSCLQGQVTGGVTAGGTRWLLWGTGACPGEQLSGPRL